MRRCAIAIGHSQPVTAVNAYANNPPTEVSKLPIEHIIILQSLLRRHKITRKHLPHVDKLSTIQQINLAIFGCHIQLLGVGIKEEGDEEGDEEEDEEDEEKDEEEVEEDTEEDKDQELIRYIADQIEALEDIKDRLDQGQRLSKRQQVFIASIRSGGGNGPYWQWFMQLKCAVAEIEVLY